MRANSGRGERKLEQALAALARALNACGAPWMIIGGIAIIARGVRRLTTDIDAVVQGDAVSVQAVIDALGEQGIAPRIERAVDFAQENLVLLVRHQPSGVDLDVSFGWTSFEVEALGQRARARYGKVSAPMASPEDLVVLKAMAARPKDLEDAAALLALYPAIDLGRVRSRLRELAAMANAPEVLDGLEAIVRSTSGATRKKVRSGKASRRRSRR
ncbi:MAG: nucleotidyltransferase [Myxococcota bacterium]